MCSPALWPLLVMISDTMASKTNTTLMPSQIAPSVIQISQCKKTTMQPSLLLFWYKRITTSWARWAGLIWKRSRNALLVSFWLLIPIVTTKTWKCSINLSTQIRSKTAKTLSSWLTRHQNWLCLRASKFWWRWLFTQAISPFPLGRLMWFKNGLISCLTSSMVKVIWNQHKKWTFLSFVTGKQCRFQRHSLAS